MEIHSPALILFSLSLSLWKIVPLSFNKRQQLVGMYPGIWSESIHHKLYWKWYASRRLLNNSQWPLFPANYPPSHLLPLSNAAFLQKTEILRTPLSCLLCYRYRFLIVKAIKFSILHDQTQQQTHHTHKLAVNREWIIHTIGWLALVNQQQQQHR